MRGAALKVALSALESLGYPTAKQFCTKFLFKPKNMGKNTSNYQDVGWAQYQQKTHINQKRCFLKNTLVFFLPKKNSLRSAQFGA